MKKAITTIYLSLALLLGFQTAANAIVISDTFAGAANGTNVGLIDLLLAEDSHKGSPTDELAWVNTILSPNSTTYNGFKTESVDFYFTDTANVYAFSLASQPGYYIMKNSTRVALFENKGELGWGVFDLSQFNYDMKLGDLKISHVTEFGGGSTVQVAEPQTLLLLALGLLGLAASRRLALI